MPIDPLSRFMAAVLEALWLGFFACVCIIVGLLLMYAYKLGQVMKSEIEQRVTGEDSGQKGVVDGCSKG